MATVTSSRFKFLLLTAIFFLPLLLAYAVYFGPDSWKPQGITAHGQLIDPARPLAKLDAPDGQGTLREDVLGGKWTLLQFIDSDCDDACAQRIWQTRQLRTSLHKRASRVQRVIVAADASRAASLQQQFAAEHPKLIVIAPSAERLQALRAQFAAHQVVGAVHLIDPLGNWLMTYAGEELDLRGMYDDIKRLLKLSNIG